MRASRSWRISFGVACILSGAAAWAEASYSFDTSGQLLSDALKTYAQTTNQSIIFTEKVVGGVQANALKGTLTADEALQELLRGTGLVAVRNSAGALEIRRPDRASLSGAPGSRSNDGLRLAQASSEGQSQTGVAESLTLEEVIVTSERRNRSIMETSTSVVVMDTAALEQRAGLDGANDLLSRIPNITSTGTSNFAPAVRGVDGTGPAQGADAFLAGTRPRLNLQIDGRPASYNEVVFGDVGMWDVQQVEVLRGPQSALQGRNAIAGTLAIKTKDPTYQMQGHARVVGGNQKNREYAAAFSAPLVADQLAFRIAAQHQSSESFVAMEPFDSVEDPREFESTTLRGKLLFEPAALKGFTTLLTLNHSEVRGPQSEEVIAPFEAHVAGVPQMPVFQPRTTSVILANSLDVSNELTLASTIAYTDFNVKRIAPVGTGNANIDGTQWVFEPTLRFRGLAGRLSGLGGVYYFDASQQDYLDLITGGTFQDDTQTKAAFGEITYAFSEKFDVTLGARYEEEQRRREGSLFIFAIDLDETYKAFLPKLVLSWHPTGTMTFGTVAGRGYNGGSAGFTYEEPFVAYTYDPEYVWNYEVFMRALLAGGRVSLTANAFYSDYTDMQLPFNLSPLSVVIRNADKVETHGLELSVRVKAQAGLEVFGSIGLLDTEVKKYPDSAIEGNELPRSPKMSGDFGFSYTHPRGFDATLDARYSSAYYSDVVIDPAGRTDPYWVANAQAGYRFSRGRLFGYVCNLFDSGKPLSVFPEYGPSATLLRPRTYGVGLQVDL